VSRWLSSLYARTCVKWDRQTDRPAYRATPLPAAQPEEEEEEEEKKKKKKKSSSPLPANTEVASGYYKVIVPGERCKRRSEAYPQMNSQNKCSFGRYQLP
jgi:hypothetical protein